MTTRVNDLPTLIGVECPKKTGEMKESDPCGKCLYYVRCVAKLYEVMDWC